MKIISALLLIPFLAQAQFFSTDYELVRPDKKNRSLYVSTQGADDDLREIMNMMTASVGHAWGTQMSLNSGSMFFRNPLPTDGKVTQSLRALAIFDYYLTYSVRQMTANPTFANPAIVDWVGARSTRDYLDQQPKVDDDLRRQGVHQAFDVIAPFFNGAVRKLPSDYKSNHEFIAEIHSAMEMQIKTRFPTKREEMTYNIPDNIAYLANSYVPLMMNGHIEMFPNATGKPSKLQIVTMMPRIGELVAPQNTLPDDWYIRPIQQPQRVENGPMIIDQVSLGKYRPKHRPQNFGVKITIDKDFSKPLEMLMTMEFGQINTGSSRVLAGMNFDEIEESLVARGYFKDNPKVRVRVGFQKLVLRLIRPNTTDKQAFDHNYKYDIKVAEGQSVLAIAVDVPQDEWYVRAKSWLIGGSWFSNCDSNAQVCSYVFKQNDLGRVSKWLMGFATNQTDAAIERMIPQAILDADKSVDASVGSVLQQIDYGVGRLENLLNNIKGLNELPK